MSFISFIMSNIIYWWESSGCVQLIDNTYFGDYGGCDPHGDPDDWSYQPVHCGPMNPPVDITTGFMWNSEPLVP